MKVIILEGGNKLVYKNKDEYTIKTSLGNFIDVNDAIKKVPSIKDSKNIKKCGYCGRYFIIIGNRQNRRKYCSDSCSKEVQRLQNTKSALKSRNFYKNQNQKIIDEYKKNKGLLPTDFNQIDDPKKLGEALLWDGIPKRNGEYDWKQEERIIKKLRKRLYEGNIINP